MAPSGTSPDAGEGENGDTADGAEVAAAAAAAESKSSGAAALAPVTPAGVAAAGEEPRIGKWQLDNMNICNPGDPKMAERIMKKLFDKVNYLSPQTRDSAGEDSAERVNGDIGREWMTMHRVYYSNGLFTIGYKNEKGVITTTIGSARMEEAA